jgi:hypothetical protein
VLASVAATCVTIAASVASYLLTSLASAAATFLTFTASNAADGPGYREVASYFVPSHVRFNMFSLCLNEEMTMTIHICEFSREDHPGTRRTADRTDLVFGDVPYVVAFPVSGVETIER